MRNKTASGSEREAEEAAGEKEDGRGDRRIEAVLTRHLWTRSCPCHAQGVEPFASVEEEAEPTKAKVKERLIT